MAPTSEYRCLVRVGDARTADGPKTSPIYRCAYKPDGVTHLEGVDTLADSWDRTVQKWPNEKALGRRTADGYAWLTYVEADKQVAQLSAALVAKGLHRGSPVGMYGPNSVEWMLAMQSANRRALRVVPLYDTLGDDAVQYVLDHAGCTAVFCLGAKLADLAKALAKTHAGTVRLVVWWGEAKKSDVDAVGAALKAAAATHEAEELERKAAAAAEAPASMSVSFEILEFSELLRFGAAAPEPAPERPTPDDLCTVMYTSGTTSAPKGVKLSHRAVLAAVLGLRDYVEFGLKIDFGPGDTMFSFLPLAHIFDRAAEEFMIIRGGALGYWRGDPRLLVADVAALRPTLFCAVPRVLERIRSGVLDKVRKGSWLKRQLFHHAYNVKLRAIRSGKRFDKAAPFWDRLVFKKVAQAMGGRVRVIVSGGAPLALRVEEFLRTTMCSQVVSGYGLTETCAATVLSLSEDVPAQIGVTGVICSPFEFRLEAVDEMGADPSAVPPKGELCVRGPSMFSGYLKDDEQTAAAFDADGFFHTGDVAIIDEIGALRIVDRKKNIFKLAQGEYIAVERVESAHAHSRAVEQIWIYGDSTESTLVAIAVPKDSWLHKEFPNVKDPTGNAEVAAAVLKSLAEAAKDAGLKGFEKVKAVYVEGEPFSVENDLLTPTFKLRRPQLKERYKEQITALYRQINGE